MNLKCQTTLNISVVDLNIKERDHVHRIRPASWGQSEVRQHFVHGEKVTCSGAPLMNSGGDNAAVRIHYIRSVNAL